MNIDRVNGSGPAFERRFADEELGNSNEEASTRRSSLDGAHGTSVLLLEGDIGAQVAALAILSAQKQRERNRELQVAEEVALQRAEDAHVDALHQKAADIRMGGLIDGAFGIGSGFLTMGGGRTDSGDEKLLYKGGATISEGAGKALGGLYRADQADDDATAAAHEHEAAHHRRNIDAARDAIREGQDLLQRTLDFYKQSQEGAAAAANSSVRRG
jgi:hypothetical protein